MWCDPSSCVYIHTKAGRADHQLLNQESHNMHLLRPASTLTSRQVPGASVQPVVANLAVDRSIRRRGIGKRILRECERVVKGTCGWNRCYSVFLH